MFDLTTFAPLIFRGKEIPNYFVNPEGLIYSLKSKQLLKPRMKRDNRTGRIESLIFDFRIPKGFFSDYGYRVESPNSRVETVTMAVHQAVANTFMPIEKNPPKKIKKYWKKLPDEVKDLIKSTLIIDHIDDDPTNNNLYNLRYVVSRENSNYVKAKTFDVDAYYQDDKMNINRPKREKKYLEVFFDA